MRILRDSDVAKVGRFGQLVAAIEEAFIALASGQAVVQPRVRIGIHSSKLSMVGAILGADGLAGAKVYPTTREGRFGFTVLLFEQEEGRLLAVIEGEELTRLRTAATSVVAARRLARPDAQILVLFGSGRQVVTHAEAYAEAYRLEEIRIVHKRDVTEVVERIGHSTGLPCRQIASSTIALKDADLVVTATRSSGPLFAGIDLPGGVHVTAVGATLPNSQELDVDTVRRADVVVVEIIEQAKREAGDLILAASAGAFDWQRAFELGDLVAGKVSGRTADGQITLFESLGIGLEDAAAAAAIYHEAVAQGVGVEIPTEDSRWGV